jgi:archaemetzincin
MGGARSSLIGMCMSVLAAACSGDPQAAAQPSPRPASAEPAPVPPPKAQRVIKLVVLQSFPPELQQVVAHTVEDTWRLHVEWLDMAPLPKSTFYPARKRYRADLITEHLAGTLPGGHASKQLILGLTEVDVSATKGKIYDWGILGLAQIGGPAGVLSSHRILPSAHGPEQVRHRVAIIAAHEVGHMFGLQHCDEPGCVMRDAEGHLAHVDESNGELGPICRARLRGL